MTRTHYVAIAEVMRQSATSHATRTDESGAALAVLALVSCRLANVLERDNPRGFDRARFLEACGIVPAPSA